MRGPGLFASVLAVALLTAVAANGATDAAPPKVSFSGTYSVTYRITNAKNIKPSHWIYGVTCASPCSRLTIHQRLATEKSWRPNLLVYTWNGRGFVIARTQRNISDCLSSSGKAVAKGYDVKSTQTLMVIQTVNGRVVKLSGTGQDAYNPNAKGLRAGCVAGSYVFAITGTAR